MASFAFIFDLNGTMIDDMGYHAKAWFDILNNDLKAGLTLNQVRAEMYGKNVELLDRVFGKNHFSPEREQEISVEKERKYQEAFRPHLSLIKGLDQFLQKTKEDGISMAVGTAAIPINVNFVLDGLNIRHYFKAIVTADDVIKSKPDPETFTKCAELMQVSPANCIVFEDAPKGVEAALNAGMSCVAITTMHPKEEFKKYKNVISFIGDYSLADPQAFIKMISKGKQ
ncbi:MAG: HAD family phosphatase [Ginsengibacter sp.]